MCAGIKTLYSIRCILPLLSRINLVQSLVLSHFQYSACLLTSVNSSLMYSLEKQINWALKVAFFKQKFSSARILKLRSGILPVRDLLNMRCLCYTWKLINRKLPAFDALHFPNFHLLDLRENMRNKMLQLRTRLNSDFSKLSFLNHSVNSWNKLSIQNLPKVSYLTFKKKVRSLLFKEFRQRPPDRIISNVWSEFRIL